MNGEVIDQDLKEKAFTLCKDFLGGQWKKISISEFKFSELRGGLSNKLYRCSLPENAAKEPRVPKEVLWRIYGCVQDDPDVLVAGDVTFMLLSERKLGPKLYGVLPKGRLEEFIPSHSLNSDEIRRYAPLIAREMAKIHSLDVPLKKTPDLFPKYSAEFLKEVEDVLQKDNEQYFLSLKEYKKEIEWLITEMSKTNSPIVYCHNDLVGGNILFREDVTQNENPSLMLIDFEFGAYNYRGFDLANHFCEWCFDYSTPEYPHFVMNLDKFPSRKEQIEYFTNYLDQLSKEGILCKRPLEEELESMLREISLFAGAACILWSLWSAKMTILSNYQFPHREHGKVRKKLYHKFKEQYLATLSENNNNPF